MKLPKRLASLFGLLPSFARRSGRHAVLPDASDQVEPLFDAAALTLLRQKEVIGVVAERLDLIIDAGDDAAALAQLRFVMAEAGREQALDASTWDAPHRADAMRYYNLVVQLVAGRTERAFRIARDLEIGLIPDIDVLPYSAMRRQAGNLRQGIAASLDRAGVRPCAIVTSMPRSASSFLSSILSTMLDSPIARITIGWHPDRVIVEPWLRTMLRGNCVIHDHLPPTADTEALLVRHSPHSLFFQFRDPRETAWSAIQQIKDEALRPDFLQQLEQEIAFMTGWLDIIDAGLTGRIGLIDYREVRAAPRALFVRILDSIGAPFDAAELDQCLARAYGSLGDYNFRQGDSAEWRRSLPPRTVLAADSMMPLRITTFLERTDRGWSEQMPPRDH